MTGWNSVRGMSGKYTRLIAEPEGPPWFRPVCRIRRYCDGGVPSPGSAATRKEYVMDAGSDRSRRGFLHVSAALGIGGLVAGCASQGRDDGQPDKEKEKEAEKAGAGGEEDVSPAEDLMREHGVLKRVLLVYGE